jgi:hypothetical protein
VKRLDSCGNVDDFGKAYSTLVEVLANHSEAMSNHFPGMADEASESPVLHTTLKILKPLHRRFSSTDDFLTQHHGIRHSTPDPEGLLGYPALAFRIR